MPIPFGFHVPASRLALVHWARAQAPAPRSLSGMISFHHSDHCCSSATAALPRVHPAGRCAVHALPEPLPVHRGPSSIHESISGRQNTKKSHFIDQFQCASSTLHTEHYIQNNGSRPCSTPAPWSSTVSRACQTEYYLRSAPPSAHPSWAFLSRTKAGTPNKDLTSTS
jgi:hypothetical protein